MYMTHELASIVKSNDKRNLLTKYANEYLVILLIRLTVVDCHHVVRTDVSAPKLIVCLELSHRSDRRSELTNVADVGNQIGEGLRGLGCAASAALAASAASVATAA